MQMTLKTQALAGLTALFAVALIAAVIVLFPRTPVFGPADLLPADRTIALFADLDSASAEILAESLPVIHTLPVQEEPATFALVKMNDGHTAWIMFKGQGVGKQAAITTSDNAALALLGQENLSLSGDSSFRSLGKTRTPGMPWAYIRIPEVAPVMPASLTVPHGPVSIAMGTNDMHIAWMSEEPPKRRLTSGIKDLFTHPVLSIQSDNLRQFIASAGTQLTDEKKLAHESRLRAWFNNAFGSDLSMTYDFLPLLENQSTINIGRNSATGTVLIIAEGTHDTDPSSLLDALHEGFQSSLAGIDRMQRTFDDKFTYDNLRSDQSSVTHTEERTGGWTLTITARGSKTLVSAVNGKRFIIGNDLSLVRSAASAYPPPLEGTAPVAQGMIDPAAMRTMLQSWLPGEHLPLPAPLDKRTTLLHWDITQSGNMSVLRLF